jgi:hypothetical protein
MDCVVKKLNLDRINQPSLKSYGLAGRIIRTFSIFLNFRKKLKKINALKAQKYIAINLCFGINSTLIPTMII